MLENKAELVVAHARQFVAGELRHFLSVQPVTAAAGVVEAAEQVHEGGFSGTRWTHDSDKFAGGNVERDAAQCRHHVVAHDVILGQAFDPDERLAHGGKF